MNDSEREVLADPTLRAWWVDGSEFPAGGSVADALEFCVQYAVLAPSVHNTQPWWFRVHGTSITIGHDLSRGLPLLDPDDREALISVGASAFILRVALAHFGFSVTGSTWPDPTNPQACLRLDVSEESVDVALMPLFDAITRRRTSRAAFDGRPAPDDVIRQLVADAAGEGATFHIVTDHASRQVLAELVSAADHEQMSDKRFRRELASWLRPAHSRRLDGIRWHGSGLEEVLSAAAPLVLRTFDVGDGRAAHDHQLAEASPTLAVLSTERDDRSAWLCAGQALGRLLLRATANDLSVGYLNQPVELAHLRPELAEAVNASGPPQLLMRIGYGPPPAAQPRRAVDKVLDRA